MGKTGLGKVFGNVLHRKEAFLDYENIDFWVFAKLEFFKGVNPWNGKTKHRSLNGLLVYRGDISILYLPTGHYYPGSRGPFSKYFGTSCEFWSEHFKRAKVVHTWVSVVARKLPSSLLPLKKVCVVGIQKRGGKLRARDEGKGTRCTVISPPTKSPPRSLLTPDNNSAKIDTVYLPGIVTSSSSLNISL